MLDDTDRSLAPTTGEVGWSMTLMPRRAGGGSTSASPESAEQLVWLADGLHASIGHGFRRLFSVLAAIDLAEAWSDTGARDMAHWIQMR